VSTISIDKGGRPLLDLEELWELTFYGFYMPRKHRHQDGEIGT
jgi:hypothetical protein